MERKIVLEKIQEIFRDILDNDNIILTESTCADDIEEWDSLSHIQLIVAIEKDFKVKFTSTDIFNWVNVGEMINTIEERIS